MVNEAFITEFQTGNRTHLPELWDSVRPFVARQARRRVEGCQGGGTYCGVELEDLIQEGFLAFLRAAKTYRGGGRMTFLGWLDLHLKNAFNGALGVRTVREAKNPMRWAVSLSQPVGEPGGADTLADILPGPETGIEAAERSIWQEQLCAAVSDALEEIPADWRSILTRRYWQGQTIQQIAAAEGVSHQTIADKTVRALKRLRKADTAGRLREFAYQ